MGCGCDCADGEVRRRRVAELAFIATTTSTAATTCASSSGAAGAAEKQTARNGGERKNGAEGGNGSSADGGRARGARNSNTNPNTAASKDTWKAPQSAAVERTRGLLLRESVGSVSGTGTGSESDREGGIGGRKTVRLLTPGEERQKDRERSRTRTGSRMRSGVDEDG